MLFAEPTKQGVGFTLYGDYNDLRNLHETIHEFSGNMSDYCGYQIAYELRKAYEGSRKLKIIEKNRYLGTNLTWVQALFSASFFRQCAGFQPTNKEHQANLYRFEYCIENALLEYDPKVGREIINQYPSIGCVSKDFLQNFVDELTYHYVFAVGTGKMRFKRLPQLLRQINEWSNEYKEYAERMTAQAKKHDRSPHELYDMTEWAEFEW